MPCPMKCLQRFGKTIKAKIGRQRQAMKIYCGSFATMARKKAKDFKRNVKSLA
jgi:hypothetical protein